MALGDCHYGHGGVWWSNGFGVAIVAQYTEGIDWAAYIGAQPDGRTTEQLMTWVARHGAKIDEELARFVFPQMKEVRYRL